MAHAKKLQRNRIARLPSRTMNKTLLRSYKEENDLWRTDSLRALLEVWLLLERSEGLYKKIFVKGWKLIGGLC
jgi:hypothetical protein